MICQNESLESPKQIRAQPFIWVLNHPSELCSLFWSSIKVAQSHDCHRIFSVPLIFDPKTSITSIVVSTSPSTHADLFILLMKGIFDTYVLWPLHKKLISWLVTHINNHNFIKLQKEGNKFFIFFLVSTFIPVWTVKEWGLSTLTNSCHKSVCFTGEMNILDLTGLAW